MTDSAKEAREFFDAAMPYIEEIVERSLGSLSVDGIWDDVEAGRHKMWPSKRSIIFYQVLTLGTQTGISIGPFAGERADLEEQVSALSENAAKIGLPVLMVATFQGQEVPMPGVDIVGAMTFHRLASKRSVN